MQVEITHEIHNRTAKNVIYSGKLENISTLSCCRAASFYAAPAPGKQTMRLQLQLLPHGLSIKDKFQNLCFLMRFRFQQQKWFGSLRLRPRRRLRNAGVEIYRMEHILGKPSA
jgi:hypothetical protein